MLSSELNSLRAEALRYLEASNTPCSAQSVARQLFGPRRHEDPVAQLVVRKLLDGEPGFLQTHDGCWSTTASASLAGSIDEAVFVVVDLEATGSLIGVDKIIEVGMALCRGGEVVDRLSSLVKCSRPIPSHVRRLTGISSQALEAAPTFPEVAVEVSDFLSRADVFVAHDVWFDLAFLRWELKRLDRKPPVMPALCSLRLARTLWPDLSGWRLKDLAARFEVGLDHPHRAGDDALATAGVLFRELELAVELGAETLADLYRLRELIADRAERGDDGDALAAHATG